MFEIRGTEKTMTTQMHVFREYLRENEKFRQLFYLVIWAPGRVFFLTKRVENFMTLLFNKISYNNKQVSV